MLRRYIGSADGGSPTPSTGALFQSVSPIGHSTDWVTQGVLISGGPASGTVTVEVILYVANNPSFSSFNISYPGVSRTLTLGQTINIPTDATGRARFTTITSCADIVGSTITVKLNIISVSSGAIGSPSSAAFAKTFGS